MSVEAKQLLMHDLEKRLSNILTVNNTEEVMKLLSEQLSNYELEKNQSEEPDIESRELLEAYISAKRIEGRSEKTLERYQYIIRKMMEKLDVPLRKISVFHIRRYLADEKERGLSDRTLEGIREVLSAYFGWLHKEGLIVSNPIVNLGAIKYQKVKRMPYSSVDIEKLKENCTNDRDKAIISFLLSTGCRISEVCALNRTDIDYENKECTVLGKGNKERTVFLDDVTAMLLKRYIEGRNDQLEALFIGKGSMRLTPGGVRHMLHKVADRAEVKNTHPHRFRRTLATSLLDHGMPIQEVAVLLGHDKIDTTMTYVYIDKNNVKNSYRKFV